MQWLCDLNIEEPNITLYDISQSTRSSNPVFFFGFTTYCNTIDLMNNDVTRLYAREECWS